MHLKKLLVENSLRLVELMEMEEETFLFPKVEE